MFQVGVHSGKGDLAVNPMTVTREANVGIVGSKRGGERGWQA